MSDRLRQFNTSWIKDEYSASLHLFSRPHNIVGASHYNNLDLPARMYFDNVLIGRLIQICVPNTSGQYFGRTPTVANSKAIVAANPAKKVRTWNPHAAHAMMLLFGDYGDLPGCFAIFVERKVQVQKLIGHDISLCETIRVGQMFAIKDPKPSNETLGESIYIVREPMCIVGIIDQGWPEHKIVTSSEGNWQVYFDESGKEITVYGPYLLTTPKKFNTCNGYTCDRQTYCKGCFGKAPTQKPIVLVASIVVENCPGYNTKNKEAFFHGFSSLQFTEYFFQDLPSLSQKHPSALTSIFDEVATKVQEMVEYINAHGGWRLCGWHRQGVKTETATGDSVLNSETSGHLILVQPSNMAALDSDAFKALKIATPTDDRLPDTLAINNQPRERDTRLHEPPQQRRSQRRKTPTEKAAAATAQTAEEIRRRTAAREATEEEQQASPQPAATPPVVSPLL